MLLMFCELPEGYKPSYDEPFMSIQQREYFRRRLLAWRDEILQHAIDTRCHLQEDKLHEPDDMDNAALEEDLSIELMARDSEAKLLVKIEDALQRLENGTYGFCEATGEPIALDRLDARLVAMYCIEAQEAYECEKKLYIPGI